MPENYEIVNREIQREKKGMEQRTGKKKGLDRSKVNLVQDKNVF